MTKILSHETIIFGLKMMVKSGLDFFFEILRAPSEKAGATLNGHEGFQNKKSDHFSPSFLSQK